MNEMVNQTCNNHPNKFDCPDSLIHFSRKFREYGLIIHDGGTSSVSIQFCPFCDTELPGSKRNECFKKLEEMGVEDPFEEQIPKEFETEDWHAE